ncbi:MAG: hypothetical protein H0U35_02775 [Sporichthyaceae bacterium]|nr:hypothetical protein [Sporichthyaceae bacterium]
MRCASDPLFRGLVDDAALFPPGNAPMDVALREHQHYRAAPWAAAVGPFLCPASRIEEFVSAASPGDPVSVALIFDVTSEALLRACRAWLDYGGVAHWEAVYGRHGLDAKVFSDGSTGQGLTAFLEVPRTGFESALDLVGSLRGFAAKYRTGGKTAEAFPTEDELAAFLVACTRRGLAFKLTAGLHHAVRWTSEEGFEQHGVLNVLVATRVALTGGTTDDIVAVLAEQRPAPLVGFVQEWDEATCADVRNAFRSFGCCGVTDPLRDLQALGVLEAESP